MTDTIKTTAEKLGNLKLDESAFENWNYLPPEIKLECIKTLGFKDLWSLRSTSSTERALADTQKPRFWKIAIISNKVHVNESDAWSRSKSSCDFNFFIYRHGGPEKYMPVFQYIFKRGIIENLKVTGGKERHLAMNLLKETSHPFSVEKLELNEVDSTEINFWLGRIKGKMESISIGCPIKFDRLMNIPAITDVKFLHIAKATTRSCAHQLAQIWIDKNSEVGRTLQTIVWSQGVFDRFAETFSDRIIIRSPKVVRIRTDHPKKHIILELGAPAESDCAKQHGQFIRMSIVPAIDNNDNEELDGESESEPWVKELQNLQYRQQLKLLYPM